jgi:hypothetical protein
MKLRQWLMVSLIPLVILGCIGKPQGNQASENTAPASPQASLPSSESQASGQLASSTHATTIKSGVFVSGEHKTQGKVQIVTQNGQSFLELEQAFRTSNMGPDLVVILHRSENVLGSTKPPAYPLKEGDYIILAPLQKFSGAQRYVIPKTVNLAAYRSAAIWCRKFNATFGAAKLISQ